MTNYNYTALSNLELISKINGFDIPITHLNRFLKNHHIELYNEVIRRTDFLDNDISISARLYCIEHSLINTPICENPNCSNHVSWYGKSNMLFKKYCCVQCQRNDPNYWLKIRSTNIIRFGVEYPSQSKEIKCKIRNTCIDRYGVDNPAKTIEVQQKMKNTCIERYGVDNVFKLDDVKENIRTQQFDKFDGHWFVETQEFKEKSKETLYEHYGVDHPMKSLDIVESGIQTCIERYGVSRVAKSPLFSSYHRKRIFHDGIYFDSTREVSVYEFCKMNNIKFEYSPSITYEYEYDGKIYTYHPDFLIDGKVYEVKGDNFFRINESTGTEEMYCPWRYPEWSDEHYNWMCGKYEAKHQCMLKNNVVILREGDMKNLEMRVKHTCIDA